MVLDRQDLHHHPQHHRRHFFHLCFYQEKTKQGDFETKDSSSSSSSPSSSYSYSVHGSTATFILQKKKTSRCKGKTSGWLADWLLTPLPPLRRRTRRHGRQKKKSNNGEKNKNRNVEKLRLAERERERERENPGKREKHSRARERNSSGKEKYIPGKWETDTQTHQNADKWERERVSGQVSGQGAAE